jgi:hypothetical protein
VHSMIRMSTVFVSDSGEWKIGGFELLSSTKDEHDNVIYVRGLPQVSPNVVLTKYPSRIVVLYQVTLCHQKWLSRAGTCTGAIHGQQWMLMD